MLISTSVLPETQRMKRTFTASPVCMCAAAKTAWNLEKLLVLFKSKESCIFFMQPIGFGCIIQEILYYVCALGYLGRAQCGQWILDAPEVVISMYRLRGVRKQRGQQELDSQQKRWCIFHTLCVIYSQVLVDFVDFRVLASLVCEALSIYKMHSKTQAAHLKWLTTKVITKMYKNV